MWEPILLKEWQNIPLGHKDCFELNVHLKMAGGRRMLWPQPPSPCPAPPHSSWKQKIKLFSSERCAFHTIPRGNIFISGARGENEYSVQTNLVKITPVSTLFSQLLLLFTYLYKHLGFANLKGLHFLVALHVHENNCFLLL